MSLTCHAHPSATPAPRTAAETAEPALMTWSTTLGRWLALAPPAAAPAPRKQRWSYRPAFVGGVVPLVGEPDGGAAAHGCGWYDSSQDLREGLIVEEHDAASPEAASMALALWLDNHRRGGRGQRMRA